MRIATLRRRRRNLAELHDRVFDEISIDEVMHDLTWPMHRIL